MVNISMELIKQFAAKIKKNPEKWIIWFNIVWEIRTISSIIMVILVGVKKRSSFWKTLMRSYKNIYVTVSMP